MIGDQHPQSVGQIEDRAGIAQNRDRSFRQTLRRRPAKYGDELRPYGFDFLSITSWPSATLPMMSSSVFRRGVGRFLRTL